MKIQNILGIEILIALFSYAFGFAMTITTRDFFLLGTVMFGVSQLIILARYLILY